MSTSLHLDSADIATADAERVAEQLSNSDAVVVGGVAVPLSESARGVLSEVFSHLAAGRSVDVVPVTDWLSTSEAAALLHVSRPTLVHMLESGLIKYEQPGVHRRVSRAALDTFLADRDQRREKALNDLALAEGPAAADGVVQTR